MINRDRRKTIGNIFADTAKYTLTAGIIGKFVNGGLSALDLLFLMVIVLIFGFGAYFAIPKNMED